MPPKKVPAQLAHLVKWLPDLTAEAWVAVVQDARVRESECRLCVCIHSIWPSMSQNIYS